MDEPFFERLARLYRSENLDWQLEENAVRETIAKLEGDADIKSRYRLLSPLGVGGVGIVLKALDLKLRTSRAIKLARPTAGKAKLFDEIMTEEISHLLETSHPNIVQIYHVGRLSLSTDSCPYYVMEYIEGARDAAKYFKTARKESELISALRQILAGLRHLHEHRVMHGDVKLENILVAGDGSRAVISDLGSARNLDKGTKKTFLIYTEAWAHPSVATLPKQSDSDPNRIRTKQVLRSSLRLDFDVYALGKNILRLLASYSDRDSVPLIEAYTYKYLHLMACRMLDGHNNDEERALGLPLIGFREIKYVDFIDETGAKRPSIDAALTDLRKLTGEYSSLTAVPELNVNPLYSVQASSLGVTPFTKRLGRLLSQPLLTRLAGITQLGFLTLLYPTASHSRLEHVLGTFTNVVAYCNALYNDALNPLFRQLISAADLRTLLLAALFHDLGQYPLAHDLQDANDAFFDHEDISIGILEGEYADADVIALRTCISRDWNVDPTEIAQVIRPESDRPPRLNGRRHQRDAQMKATPAPASAATKHQLLRSVISGPIDADKMDYLVRDSVNLNVPFGKAIDFKRLLQCLTVIYREEGNSLYIALGIHEKGKIPAETVAFARYAMFGAVYWHHTSRAGKAMLHRAVWEGFRYRGPEWTRAALIEFALRSWERQAELLKANPVSEHAKDAAMGLRQAEFFPSSFSRATQILASDREMIEWIGARTSKQGGVLLQMLLSRSLFGRVCVISKTHATDLDEDGNDADLWTRLVAFRTDREGRDARGILSLQNSLQALILQKMSNLTVAARERVTRMCGEDAISAASDAHERGDILFLLDIPTQRKGTRTRLEYLPEAVRRELLGQWTEAKPLEHSVVWQRLHGSFLESVGKVRLLCHPDYRETFELAIDRREFETLIDQALRKAIEDGRMAEQRLDAD